MIYEHTIVHSSISIRYKYKLPNQKAVVLINQSICHYLIDAKQMSNSFFTNFFTVLKKQIGKWCEIKSRKLLSQKFRCSCFIFKEDHLFIEEEHNSSDNVVTVVDKLHGYDVDGIRNFLDFARLMFINLLIKKMGILK